MPEDRSNSDHTILIVEDDKEVLSVMQRYLTGEGLQVLTAESVPEARGVMESGQRVNLVLLDLVMPHESGFTFLSYLRSKSEYCEIPVLILTALDAPGDRIKGLEAGADDYLTKPYDMQEMLARSQVLLRQHDCTQSARGRAKEAEALLQEQKRLTQKLEETNRELANASVIKNHFISAASHDLRSPLTNVKGYCELMLAGTLGEINTAQQDALKVISRNCQHVLDLLSKLLDVSRLDTGEYTLHFAEYPLGEIIATAMNISLLSAREKSISIHIAEEADYPPKLYCDRDAVLSVLENLIGNAVKFCSKGDSVEVGSERGDGEVIISVTDTGPGIAENELDKLFKRFSRLTNRPTGGEKSVGLGLSIVHDLVNLHGGRVAVESEPGKGCCFAVHLPTDLDQLRVSSPS